MGAHLNLAQNKGVLKIEVNPEIGAVTYLFRFGVNTKRQCSYCTKLVSGG